MTVYLYRPRVESFDCVKLVDPAQIEVLQRLEGLRQRASWSPLPVKVLAPEGKSRHRRSDFPSLLGMTPVFSQRAWAVLEPLIGAEVEALPLLCADYSPLRVLNVLDLVPDALDPAGSVVDRFSDGSVMAIEKYVLRRRAVGGHHFFKLAEAPRGRVLVSDEFKRLVEKHRLKGLAQPLVGLALDVGRHRQPLLLADQLDKHLRYEALRGVELVDGVTRLCAMNLFLHGIGPDDDRRAPPIRTDDSSATSPPITSTW